MSVEISAAVDVDARAEQVWAAVTDWERQGDWIPGTVVRVVGGDGRSTGSRLLAFTGVFDIGFVDHMVIVEWEPPRRCLVRHTGWLLRGTGEFAVHARGDGSTFVWTERLDPPFGPVGRLGLTLLRPPTRAVLHLAGRRLAAGCERRSLR